MVRSAGRGEVTPFARTCVEPDAAYYDRSRAREIAAPRLGTVTIFFNYRPSAKRVTSDEINQLHRHFYDRHRVRHGRPGFRPALPSRAPEAAAIRLHRGAGRYEFCVASGCTIKRASNGFDLNCSNGLTGHFALNKARDL